MQRPIFILVFVLRDELKNVAARATAEAVERLPLIVDAKRRYLFFVEWQSAL